MAMTYQVPYDEKNRLLSVIRYTAPRAGTLEIFLSYKLDGHENNHDDHGLLAGVVTGNFWTTMADNGLGPTRDDKNDYPKGRDTHRSYARIYAYTSTNGGFYDEEDYNFGDDKEFRHHQSYKLGAGEIIEVGAVRMNVNADPIPGGEFQNDQHGMRFEITFDNEP